MRGSWCYRLLRVRGMKGGQAGKCLIIDASRISVISDRLLALAISNMTIVCTPANACSNFFSFLHHHRVRLSCCCLCVVFA
jgi:hypothetical protein